MSQTAPGSENEGVLISYCATFLKPEMLHVFRQVCGVDSFENWVVTRRRENAASFPYARLVVLKKSPLRIFRREAYRLLGRQAPLGSTEVGHLLAIAEEKRAALVHIYFGTEAARALPYLKRERRAKVVSFHGADVSTSLGDADFDELLGCVDLFLARSQTLAEQLIARGCPSERIRLNRTSVPIPDHAAAPHPERNGGYRLLQACRFIPKKGLDISLKAVSSLVAKGIDVTLDLAGDGPEEAALQALVAELGLQQRVHFLGFLANEDLLARLPDYSLFVHPSRVTTSGDREGIPNAMLEAMACGLPVVATGHSGIPEAVSDGIEGRLVPQDDPDALAAVIAEVLGDTPRYAAMSAAARARVISDFSLQRSIDELCSSYRQAIELAACRSLPEER
jgi:colanic acid/amylovoran biosynthesis glycosyltransferase